VSNPKTKQPQSPGRPVADTPVVQYTSVAGYFHEQVVTACADQGLSATEPAEYYVVTMLESFTHADALFRVNGDGRRDQEALAQVLARALLEPAPGKQLDHYRRLGDSALYLAGIFADSLRRTTVGLSYYVRMGQSAYATLASHGRNTNAALREIFHELSQTFAGWVEVLRQLGAQFGLVTPTDELETADVYERWQLAPEPRSEQLGDELLRRGVMPSGLVLT
jgi:hypothetical protein